MDDLVRGAAEAWRLLFSGDPEVYGILGRSLAISAVATLLAMIAGVPLGYAIARSRFRGRTLLLTAVNTGMGVPPVVVGLVVWLLLARSGPLGGLNLVYTRSAMALAQFAIATPLVVGFTAASIQALPPQLPDLLQEWVKINLERAPKLPVINDTQEPLPTAAARKKELGFG